MLGRFGRLGLLALALAFVSAARSAWAQEKAAQGDAAAGAEYVPTMTFDVASIREAKPNPDGMIVGGGFRPFNSSQLKMMNVPIVWLLERGYGVDEYQIAGMPDWVYDNATIYNIEAKADGAADAKLATLTKEQVKLEQEHMFQVLLAERFNFKTHWETRQGRVLNLIAAKGGKLHPGGSMPPTAEELKNFGDRPIPPIYQRGNGELGYEFVAHGCSMADLASYLAVFEDMDVVDATGLSGKYDFVMRYSQASRRERNQNPDIWPSIADALEDQLGLKFANGTGATQVLVVDHIDKPSEN